MPGILLLVVLIRIMYSIELTRLTAPQQWARRTTTHNDRTTADAGAADGPRVGLMSVNQTSIQTIIRSNFPSESHVCVCVRSPILYSSAHSINIHTHTEHTSPSTYRRPIKNRRNEPSWYICAHSHTVHTTPRSRVRTESRLSDSTGPRVMRA